MLGRARGRGRFNVRCRVRIRDRVKGRVMVGLELWVGFTDRARVLGRIRIWCGVVELRLGVGFRVRVKAVSV